MIDYDVVTKKTSVANSRSLPSTFDSDEAAHILARHFEKTSCPSSTISYDVDFMRQVAPVFVVVKGSGSSTFPFELDSGVSSSACEVGLKQSIDALKLTYALEELGRHREAAREVMRLIEENLHATTLNVANTFLADADVKKLSSRSLIGLIRSSSRARDALPAWNAAYKRSWSEVKRQDKNPEALFVGLPRPVGV